MLASTVSRGTASTCQCRPWSSPAQRARVQPGVPRHLAERAAVDARAISCSAAASAAGPRARRSRGRAARRAAGRGSRSPTARTRARPRAPRRSCAPARPAPSSSAHTGQPASNRSSRVATSGAASASAVSCEWLWSSDAPDPGPSLIAHSDVCEAGPGVRLRAGGPGLADLLDARGRQLGERRDVLGARARRPRSARRAARAPGTGSARRGRPRARRRGARASRAASGPRGRRRTGSPARVCRTGRGPIVVNAPGRWARPGATTTRIPETGSSRIPTPRYSLGGAAGAGGTAGVPPPSA